MPAVILPAFFLMLGLSHLYALTRTLPVIMLTAKSGEEERIRGLGIGADDYVVKPLDMRLFNARVRLLYRIKGLERPRRELGA